MSVVGGRMGRRMSDGSEGLAVWEDLGFLEMDGCVSHQRRRRFELEVEGRNASSGWHEGRRERMFVSHQLINQLWSTQALVNLRTNSEEYWESDSVRQQLKTERQEVLMKDEKSRREQREQGDSMAFIKNISQNDQQKFLAKIRRLAENKDEEKEKIPLVEEPPQIRSQFLKLRQDIKHDISEKIKNTELHERQREQINNSASIMFRKMLLKAKQDRSEKKESLDPQALAKLEKQPIFGGFQVSPRADPNTFTLNDTAIQQKGAKKPEEQPFEGGIMSIFKMKNPEGVQLKRKERDLIEERRAKLRLELAGRVQAESDPFKPNLASFVFDDDVETGRATYGLRKGKAEFMQECRIRFYEDLGPQTRQLNRLSEREAAELRAKTKEVLNADDPLYTQVSIQSYLHAIAGQVDLQQLLTGISANDDSFLSELPEVRHSPSHPTNQSTHLSQASPDFNNRIEIHIGSVDNDSSMFAKPEQQSSHHLPLSARSHNVSMEGGDNQFSGSIIDPVRGTEKQSESETLIQSARVHDAQMRAALSTKDPARTANRNKNTSKSGSKTISKRSLKNTPMRGQTRGSKSKAKKSPMSSRYNTQDLEGGEEDEAVDILEQLRRNEEEQARIAVEMAKKQKAQRDRNSLYR